MSKVPVSSSIDFSADYDNISSTLLVLQSMSINF